MYLLPLNQIESVELVIHALRAAAGEADCSVCPVRKVCMQQCLTIADSIGKMVEDGTLPGIDITDEEPTPKSSEAEKKDDGGASFLKVVK